MKAYPIIYSRTKFADYVHGFLARPADLDFELASKYATEAMLNIKDADGIRHAVFSIGNYVVYGGTACVAPQLVKRIIKERTIDFDYSDYQADKVGRPLVFFIGFAILKSDIHTGEIPIIDLHYTYKVYLQFLKKQWEAATAKTEIVTLDSALDIETKQYSLTGSIDEIEYEGRKYLKNYNESDYQMYIDYYFSKILENPTMNISFLSQISANDCDRITHYKVVSLTDVSVETYITNSKTKKAVSSTQKASIDPDMELQIKRTTSRIPEEEKKKGLSTGWLVTLILLSLVIVALITTMAIMASRRSANKKDQKGAQTASQNVISTPTSAEHADGISDK